MASETPSTASRGDNESQPRSRARPRRLGSAVQATTRRLQLKSGLTWNRYTVTMAVKASIPPAILLCAIQSDAWVNFFKTQSYLAAIISACVLPSLPRARLVEYNFQLSLAVVLSYCWVLLGGWCAVQARKHTTADNAPEALKAYSSSAEAVAAIFLMFWTWCVFALKSAFPAWGIQCTWGGIIAVATLPIVAQAPRMQDVIASASKTLEVVLAGQAVGFVNALVIFPQSCRGVFRRDMGACLDALVAVMRAQKQCTDDFRSKKAAAEGDDGSTSIGQLQNALQLFINSALKARGNVEYAERELAWDRLGHSRLEHLASMLVDLVPPASGLGSTAGMLHRAITSRAGGRDGNADPGDDAKNQQYWHDLEDQMHEQSDRMSDAIIDGAEHAKVRLELVGGRSLAQARRTDEENQASSIRPGNAGFLESYRDVFGQSCVPGQGSPADGEDGVKLLDHYIRHRPQIGDLSQITAESHSDTLCYFLLLHSHILLSSLSDEFFKLLLFAEECHARPKRLLIPRLGRPRYWLMVLVHAGGSRSGSSPTYQSMDTQPNVELGSAFYHPRDPDHLPPATLIQAVGDQIRRVNSVFRTNHAAYGLRGVCAVMTICIIAFLRDSQDFYFRQRFLWALFAILLSMGRTAGSSTFLLLCRMLGTLASMVASYIIWYIVDEKTPGILVFAWLWFAVIGFFIVNYPRFFSVWFVALITAIVMIANELQVRQLGEETVAEAGHAVYPPYTIFPYRLAIVSLGVVVAYFWTLFPFPLSEHAELREEVAKSCYILATFSKCIQQTIRTSLHGVSGALDDPTSPGFHLQATRRRIFRKYQSMAASARTYFGFLDWEFSLGGRFPKGTYSEILEILERVSSYMILSGYVSRAFKLKRPATASRWWAAEQNDTAEAHLTPGGVSTRMIILHSALSRAHPLPPQLTDLQIPDLNEFLTRDVPMEEGFAAAALIHTVNWFLVGDVNRLTQYAPPPTDRLLLPAVFSILLADLIHRLVRGLVGELDFSIAVDHRALGTGTTGDRTKEDNPRGTRPRYNNVDA